MTSCAQEFTSENESKQSENVMICVILHISPTLLVRNQKHAAFIVRVTVRLNAYKVKHLHARTLTKCMCMEAILETHSTNQ